MTLQVGSRNVYVVLSLFIMSILVNCETKFTLTSLLQLDTIITMETSDVTGRVWYAFQPIDLCFSNHSSKLNCPPCSIPGSPRHMNISPKTIIISLIAVEKLNQARHCVIRGRHVNDQTIQLFLGLDLICYSMNSVKR